MILYAVVGTFGWVLLLARAALGVFGRDVWAGFAAGARGTVERGCDRDARPWIEAEDRRARAVQSIRTLLSLQRYSLRNYRGSLERHLIRVWREYIKDSTN